jgi:predicted nucleic acid-binding protein
MVRVVSDASVLIHLARIGYFRLLKDLYGEIVIATGVYSEVVERGWGFPGSIETEEARRKGWLTVSSVTDRSKVTTLMHRYGISLGNAETIQLAKECEAELALADEVEVRLLLEEYGVKVRGCIGILIESAKRGVINVEEAKNGIKRLVETGYRVSDNVLKRAYELLGERR